MATNPDTNGTTTPTDDDAKRDEKGHFGKGDRGGPGNPFARQTARLRQAALDAVTDEDVRDIITALKEKAKQGDTAAAKLLFSYSIGKPTTASNPDTLDQEELQTHINNHAATPESVVSIINGMPIDILLLMIRTLLPLLADSKAEQATAILSAPQEPEEELEDEGNEDEDEPENVSTEGFLTAEQMIPDWMREIVNPKSESPKATAQPQTSPSAPAEPVKPANEVPRQQTVETAWLRALLARIGGIIEHSEPQPTPNGVNGKAQKTASG